MLWSEQEPNIAENYGTALGQLYSMEQRFSSTRSAVLTGQLYNETKVCKSCISTQLIKMLERDS